jgi:hypothetical protein
LGENSLVRFVVEQLKHLKDADSANSMAHRMNIEAGKKLFAQRKFTVKPELGILKEWLSISEAPSIERDQTFVVPAQQLLPDDHLASQLFLVCR